MKVAFWSGVSPSGGATDYLAAVGTILAIKRNCKIVLSSNHISNHMLQDCFFGKTKEEIAHTPYHFIYGTQEYFRALCDLKMNRQGSVMEIPMEGLTIIYPPDVTETMFYYEVPRSTLYLLDIAGENSIASQSALEEADIIVAFLPQDEAEIQRIFDQFSTLLPKTLFVIDRFQRNGGCSRRNFAAKYGCNTWNIGVIPQNNEFSEACQEGKLEFFIKANLDLATKAPQYNFMVNLEEIVKLLFIRYKSELMKG